MKFHQFPQIGVAVISDHSRFVNSQRSMSISRINFVLLLIASIFHLLAEASLLPLVAAFIYYCTGRVALWLTRLGGCWERHIYNQVFLTGLLVAGIAAFYRTFADDSQGDSLFFYENATHAVAGWSMLEIAAITEGALAVVLWREVYDFMATFGFPRAQYVGILVNVLVVSLSGVITLKMAKLLYGYDIYRFKILTILFSTCGLFWIFAGILLRDSVVLLSISLLAYAWLFFLCKPDIGFRLCLIVGSSLLASILFTFLRTEFTFVPIAMAMAAIAALLFGAKVGRDRSIAYFLVLFGLMLTGWLLANFGDAIEFALMRGGEGYAEQSAAQHGDSSLGMALIVNQPMLIRVPLGAVYLFFSPIPFWIGFQFESVYSLFKSFNVVYLYFIVPLLVLAFRNIIKIKSSRSPPLLFLLFVVLGFTFAIAGTSLETRHLGVFFAPMFILSLFPDMQSKVVKNNYHQILIGVLGTVVVVHYIWLVIKFGFIILLFSFLLALLLLVFTATSRGMRYTYLITFSIIVGYAFL